LRPFVKADAPWFFGRERQIGDLRSRIDRHDLIAVVGGSGVGKSSLVYAGLLPKLEKESTWRFVDMRPRGAPRAALAVAFIRMLAESRLVTPEEAASVALADHVRTTLARSASGLVDLAREWLPDDGRQLLLVVDQFEEIFRYKPLRKAGAAPSIEDEAAAFVALLLNAASAYGVPFRVMLTMRADYIGDCIRFEGLPEAISEGQYLVPRLIREQLEAVINEPLKQAGASIDHDLVEQLLNDSGREADALPVLQHVLMRLWEQAGMAAASGERRLNMDLYERVGRMNNALSLHAESTLEELTRSDLGKRAEQIVEQVMRALIEVDRQGRAIRRPIPFHRLADETGYGQLEIGKVIETMRAEARSFLRPGPPDVITDDTLIDIGHEALMRCWRRMANPKDGWVVEEFRSDLRWRSLLVQAESFEVDSSNVLPPAMAEERAEWLKGRNAAWADRYGGGWERVQGLISASLKAVKREKRRWWILTALLTTLGIVVLFLTSYVLIQRERTKKAIWESQVAMTARANAEEARKHADSLRQEAENTARTLQEAIDKLANSKPDAARALITKAEQALNDQIRRSERTVDFSTVDSSTSRTDGLRVYIQIAGESQRPAAQALKLMLEQPGKDSTTIIVPGIELINWFKGNSTLRCFRAEECKAFGQELVDKINGILQTPQVVLQDLSASYGQVHNIRPWQYELWFGPNDDIILGDTKRTVRDKK
jgi:hypothetical protein